MTAVDIGPVKQLCVCGGPAGDHYNGACYHCDDCAGYTPVADWPIKTPRPIGTPPAVHCRNGHNRAITRCGCDAAISPRPVVAQLLRDVAAGIRVLRIDGVQITEAQVAERANNIVTALLGNYKIEEA